MALKEMRERENLYKIIANQKRRIEALEACLAETVCDGYAGDGDMPCARCGLPWEEHEEAK